MAESVPDSTRFAGNGLGAASSVHVASQWTGHSIETMRKFYVQVTAEHRVATLNVKPPFAAETIENLNAQQTGGGEAKAVNARQAEK